MNVAGSTPACPLLIYGGSFDPPHRAHIDLPLAAARALGARLLFVPAGSPPHKSGRPITPAAHRLAMLKLALADHPECGISTIELDRAGPSYTVDTLSELRRTTPPGTALRLLIGADMAAIFYQWREPRRIIELAEPAVMMRRPIDAAGLLEKLPRDLPESERRAWLNRIIEIPLIDAASTDLRGELEQGRYDSPGVRENLPPRVLEYICENGLYRAV